MDSIYSTPPTVIDCSYISKKSQNI